MRSGGRYIALLLFILLLPVAGLALLTQFCVRVCKANSVAIPQELRILLPRNARLYAKLGNGLWLHAKGSLVFQFLLLLENYVCRKYQFSANLI